MIRRRVLLLAGLAPLLGAAGPADPIAGFNAGLLAAMKAGRATPFAQRSAALAPAVDAAFDLPAILQATIGPRWSGLPEDHPSI